MLKAVLFDLDGTLLPMDQDAFTEGYFKFLCKKLIPHGYEPQALIRSIWHSTGAMVRNDGSCSNEEAFWRDFTQVLGQKAAEDRPLFEEFYAVDFQVARSLCGFTPRAAETIALLKDAGVRRILATNPIFPAVATRARIRWAGLEPEDFELCTTYENIGFSKPNPAYYREILRRLDLPAEDCLMVGNDVEEDMIAARLNMPVFLLTDCLINRSDADLSAFPHGGFDELMTFLRRRLTNA